MPNSFSGLVDQIFQNNLSRFFEDDFWGFNGVNHTMNVPVNIRETDKSYELQLIAPGLKKEDFRINISGDLLTVSFEHNEEKNEGNKDQGWLRKEYRTQSFTRSFNLDETVNADNILAKYADGVLTLSIPKKDEVKRISKAIQVQ